MSNKLFDSEEIQALLQSNHLEQAMEKCLAFIKHNPDNGDALHLLGILYAKQNNFAKATTYLKLALAQDTTNIALQLHLANALKIQCEFDEATNVLKKLLAQHPRYAPALNNLGTVCFAQQNYTDATHYYMLAIQEAPNFIDAYYNLGLALAKQNHIDAAIENYKKILALSPEHFAARFQLARLYMQQNNLSMAVQEFLIVEKSQPHHFETQSNLATCYLKQGGLNLAKEHYIKALALSPDDTQILFNLGVIYTQQGEIDLAIQAYQKAVNTHPDLFEAHNNLGVSFLAKQHPEFALRHFREALRLQPSNTAIAYTVNALAQNQRFTSAPPDYITSLFDAYADHYEPHLLQALEYQAPRVLRDAILRSKTPPQNKWDILDVGCGTGLCGVALKPYANTLTGIDLSPKMIAVAQDKQIYDALTQSDIIPFLTDKIAVYDVIIAGDVVVYLGDLSDLFQAIYQALRHGGLFAFNTEIGDNTDYTMTQSGRFSHQKSYIEQLATVHHFKVTQYEKAVTRMQNNEPQYGHVFVLEKLVQ